MLGFSRLEVAVALRELPRLGHADLLKGEELIRDASEHHADESLLLENRDAEPAIAESDSKVRPAHLLKFLLAAIRGDCLHKSGGIVTVEDFGVQPAQSAMMANHRRLAHGNVQVACLKLDHRG